MTPTRPTSPRPKTILKVFPQVKLMIMDILSTSRTRLGRSWYNRPGASDVGRYSALSAGICKPYIHNSAIQDHRSIWFTRDLGYLTIHFGWLGANEHPQRRWR